MCAAAQTTDRDSAQEPLGVSTASPRDDPRIVALRRRPPRAAIRPRTTPTVSQGPARSRPHFTTLVVKITPNSVTQGQTATATASGLDQSGFPIATGTVVWSSTAPSVAIVSNAGVVTGVAAGQAESTSSTVGAVQAQATVSVAQPAPVLTSLTVSFATNPIYVGQTTTANFSGLDQFGAPFPVGEITWATANPGIAVS